MKKDARVYVAGHKGLVGSAIVRKLESMGYEHIITRTRAELDLNNQAKVAAFFADEKPEYVFLAAAKVGGIHANSSFPAEFIHDNLAIQTNILHQSYIGKVKKLIFLGSSCIYPKDAPQPMKEAYLLTGPLEPTNAPYAVAKIAGIQMCWAYNRQYGTRFIPVMPTNLYGPGDNFDLDTSHVFPAFIRKFHLAKLAATGDIQGIAKDENRFGPIPQEMRELLQSGIASGTLEIPVWGTGAPKREFLHVDDLADACHFLINRPHEQMVMEYGDILINIGCGIDLSIEELAQKMLGVIDVDASLKFDSSMPDGTTQKLLDVSRIGRLGWEPGIDLESGIRDTYRWYLKQNTNAKDP